MLGSLGRELTSHMHDASVFLAYFILLLFIFSFSLSLSLDKKKSSMYSEKQRTAQGPRGDGCYTIFQNMGSSRLIFNNSLISFRSLTILWFERNQRVFHNKASPWSVRFEIARLNASSWCSLSKTFEDFSIQDISINCKAFIFPNE